MIHTLAVSGYRSLRNLVLPLGPLNLVTGANGAGKSSLYRALRLLGDAALNTVVASLAHEGGLASTLWAGPETIARSVRRGENPVEGTPRQSSVSLKLGFAGDPFGYCIDLGYPPPAQSAFPLGSGDQARMHLAWRHLSASFGAGRSQQSTGAACAGKNREA